MNPLRNVGIFLGILCLASAHYGPMNTHKGYNRGNSIKNNLRATDFMSASELESMPPMEHMTIENFEKMALQDGAEMMEKMYHLSQARRSIQPSYAPNPSEMSAYYMNQDNEKVSFKLSDLPTMAMAEDNFANQELTIYITGMPEKSETVQKATRQMMEAYMQRYRAKKHKNARNSSSNNSNESQMKDMSYSEEKEESNENKTHESNDRNQESNEKHNMRRQRESNESNSKESNENHNMKRQRESNESNSNESNQESNENHNRTKREHNKENRVSNENHNMKKQRESNHNNSNESSQASNENHNMKRQRESNESNSNESNQESNENHNRKKREHNKGNQDSNKNHNNKKQQESNESNNNRHQPTGKLVVVELGNMLNDMRQYVTMDVEKTGMAIGDILVQMTDVANVPHEIVHVIGAQMGAHVAGAAGRQFTRRTGHKMRRITGLDPSKIFAHTENALRGLARGDAQYVDVIHTSAYGMGIPTRSGNADFYPNGPSEGVPGAENAVEATMRAVRYYAESVMPGNERNFPAVAATSMQQYKDMNGNGKRVYMGINADYNAEGDFMLQVNSKSPFGRRAPAHKQHNYHNMHTPWKANAHQH